MQFFETEVRQIVDDVWSSMLGLDVEHDPGAKLDPSRRLLSASVQISGDFQGAVVVTCPLELAQAVAGIMFGLEIDEMADDELHDALGELANMTGGNVKSLLSGELKLSLPTVTEGLELRLTVPGTRVVTEVLFRCIDQPFTVAIAKRET